MKRKRSRGETPRNPSGLPAQSGQGDYVLDGMALRRHDAAVRADAKVGRRIKALRVERGMSQRDLAAPGMSYAYLSRIEAGQRTPSLSALIELADRLDTSALYLATGRTSGRCPLCGRT